MPKRRHFGSGRHLLALAILAKPFNIVQPIHAVGFRVALRRSGCGWFGAVRRSRGCERSGGLALCRVARSEGCRAMRASPWVLAAHAVRRRRGCERQGGSSTPDGKIRVPRHEGVAVGAGGSRCSSTPDGKICAPCVIRGVSAAKGAPSRQDIRAAYSRKAICRAFRIHGAHILPKPARFGCMARESCQGGALFPSGAPSGMHGAKKLPRIAAWERIAAKSCHCQASESAWRRYLATARCLRAHSVDILPRPAGARGGIGHFALSGFNRQEQLRVCAVSVGNHEPTSRSAKLCRIMG